MASECIKIFLDEGTSELSQKPVFCSRAHILYIVLCAAVTWLIAPDVLSGFY
jgi:hypothetical protein